MNGTAFMIVTQCVSVVTSVTLVTMLLVDAVRRPRGGRRVLAVATLVCLLLGSAALSFGLWMPLEFAQLGFVLLPLLLAVYPDGRFVPRWTLWIVVCWLAVYLVELLSAHRLTSEPWWWAIASTQLVLIGAQIHRYLRRATTEEREAARWALLGVLTSVIMFLAIAAVGSGAVADQGPASIAWANLAMLPLLVGPAIGLLHPGGWDVDAALRVFLSTIGAGMALGAVYSTANWIADALGADAVAAARVGAVAVAVAAYPLIGIAWWLASLIVFRGRVDAEVAVRRLGESLDDRPEPRHVADTVAQAIVDALHLDRAVVRGDGVLSGEAGDPSAVVGEAEEFPVVFHGELLAMLVVPPRRGESSLTARDRGVVRRLAIHAAPALSGARALAELTAAHSRLLLAREEERRRLRRDLHDDLSPTLSGLGLGAAALASRALQVDDALAEAAVDLATDIQSAVEQTREVAYGLRPPILDDRGLVVAIRDRVHGRSADSLHVDVVGPDHPLGLPAAVDLAALRIAQEAVSNVRRHARATRCTVVLERRVGELRISIDDDGAGMPAQVRPGLGLASIRERAAELGGVAELGRSASGGGRVFVRLPFTEPAVPAEAVDHDEGRTA